MSITTSHASISELRRLRADFETHASRYPALSLTCYMIAAGRAAAEHTFAEPNHAILLWQYMGHFDRDTVRALFPLKPTAYRAFSGAQLVAYGVIHGPETDLFRRMASRAGSLVPPESQSALAALLTRHFVDPALPGKALVEHNSNPVAIWLNLIFFAIANYQPKRFTQSTLAVDPFAASLAVFDHILDMMIKQPIATPAVASIDHRRFKAALSFPGERRNFVGQVAGHLREQLGDVFYDEYFEAELARPNLDLLLQRIYHDNSDLVVVFLCEEYERKEWCGLEWRAIRDLIKKRRAADIIFMRFDDASVPGVFSIDGYVDLRHRTPEQAADIIIARSRRVEPDAPERSPV